MCERKWITVEAQGLVDVDAFVMFRKVPRERPRLGPTGLANVGLIEGYDTVWAIDAFPGPEGGFLPIAVFDDESSANALLILIEELLTAE